MGRPRSSPDVQDLFLTLHLLSSDSYGRYTLAKYLGLSKAKTRAILEYITELGIAESRRGRGGTRITSKGREIVKELSRSNKLDWKQEIVIVDPELLAGYEEYAILLLNGSNTDTSGLYERDLAVRSGARGAITVINEKNTWVYPGNDQIKVEKIVVTSTKNDYNMLFIVFGDDIGSCIQGLAAIAMYYQADIIERIIPF